MHWVDRGQEPDDLERVRSRYTPRWIEYYDHGILPKPRDSRWTDFKPDLDRVFFGLCAYCEERQNGEVDHFQPKSRFPKLVYVWSNWVLACHGCNHSKLNKWPEGGYVDPCTGASSERPENYFDFDLVSGEIVPKDGLISTRRLKAQTMISELGLNDVHHLINRLEWLRRVDEAVPEGADAQSPDIRQICVKLTSPTTRLPSVARAWLVKRGYLSE